MSDDILIDPQGKRWYASIYPDGTRAQGVNTGAWYTRQMGKWVEVEKGPKDWDTSQPGSTDDNPHDTGEPWPPGFTIGKPVEPAKPEAPAGWVPVTEPAAASWQKVAGAYTGKTMTMEPFLRPGSMLEDPRTGKTPDPARGNPKHAQGQAKVPLHLFPSSAVILGALVFQLGARKYGPFNWRESAVVRSIYLDAAMRHLLALLDGQDLDEESGLPHEAHVIACMAIVIDARECGKLIDDRGPAGAAAELLRRHNKPPAPPATGAR